MKYKEKIIKFLELQSDEMNKIYDKKSEKISFFSEKDKKCVEKWTEKKCKEIWETLKFNLKHDKYFGVMNNIMPFCIYQEDICDGCSYSKNHEGLICTHRDSIITQFCEDLFMNLDTNHTTYLDIKKYEKIMQKINGMG